MKAAAPHAAARQALHLKQVKAIKAAQRQLGMDDATYRDMLDAQTRGTARTGKRSATELDVAEGARVLDYLRRMGASNPKAKLAPDAKRRPAPSVERAPLLAKIHALLIALGEATGQPHGMAYADAICRRNGWADAVDFCHPGVLHQVVGALSRTLRQRQAGAPARQPAAAPAGE